MLGMPKRGSEALVAVALFRFWLLCAGIATTTVVAGVMSKSAELRRRGLTLLVLLHVVVAVLWLGVPAIAAMFALVALVGGDEIGRHHPMPRLLAPAAALASAAVVADGGVPLVVGLALTALVAALAFLGPREVSRSPAFALLFAGGVVGVGAGAVVRLATLEVDAVLALILLLQLNDGFSLVVGRRWGRRRPFPSTSPNKSVEGYLGGAVATAVGVALLATVIPVLDDEPASVRVWLFLSIVVVGNAGDLLFSRFKRVVGIKDYGSLLPGHGGVLDRLDDVLVTAILWASVWPFLHAGP